MAERALMFDCGGEALVGVLSEPEGSPRTGVLIVVGGPQYRVGSHRQFVLLARRLERAGLAVLRFDYRGMGDSCGPVIGFEESLPDVATALDAMSRACPTIENVILWGLCDAASVSLLYWHATADRRVAGMVLLNPWARSEQSLARAHVKHYYRQRVLQREFWVKLLRGGVDVRGAIRAFGEAVRTAGAGGHEAAARRATPFQDRMASAMAEFGRPILLVLSGQDLTAREFLEYAHGSQAWNGVLSHPHIERHDLTEADHTFSSGAQREALEELTVDWLARHFGGSRG
jgi:uncharacterized protein